MGRPIKKSFFGNLNAPYQDHATGGPTGAGGEGVASVGSITVGTYASGATFPGVTFGTPSTPGGTPAVGYVTVRAKALAAAPFGTQTKAYQVSQVLTMGTNGTSATVATLAATTTIAADSIDVAGVVTIAAAGTTTLLQGTSITFASDCIGVGGIPLAGTTHFVKASVTTSNTFQITDTYAHAIAGTAAAYTAGDIDSAGAPGSAVATSGSTAGALATVSTTPTAKGSYVLADTLIDAAQATTGTAPVGAGATIKVSTYEVLSVTITTAGSGYVSIADAVPTFGAGTVAATGAAVLTASYSNAIAFISYLTTGSSAIANGDILKQEASRRYLVRNAEGQGQCLLVAGSGYDATATAGQMHIIASDFFGGTYWVTKLTAHRARLVSRSSTSTAIYASGTVAPWNITAATGTYVTLNHTV